MKGIYRKIANKNAKSVDVEVENEKIESVETNSSGRKFWRNKIPRLHIPNIRTILRKPKGGVIRGDIKIPKNRIRDFEKRRDYILSHLDMLSTDSKILTISRKNGAWIALIYKILPIKSLRDR